ncbi:hypothetical protein ACVWYO_004686 [Sphingomonas sp. UYP23]
MKANCRDKLLIITFPRILVGDLPRMPDRCRKQNERFQTIGRRRFRGAENRKKTRCENQRHLVPSPWSFLAGYALLIGYIRVCYFQVDLAEVRNEHGKVDELVAIDRTSTFTFVELHEKAPWRIAGDFLRHVAAAVPCPRRSSA